MGILFAVMNHVDRMKISIWREKCVNSFCWVPDVRKWMAIGQFNLDPKPHNFETWFIMIAVGCNVYHSSKVQDAQFCILNVVYGD